LVIGAISYGVRWLKVHNENETIKTWINSHEAEMARVGASETTFNNAVTARDATGAANAAQDLADGMRTLAAELPQHVSDSDAVSALLFRCSRAYQNTATALGSRSATALNAAASQLESCDSEFQQLLKDKNG
jgi:hypothetical protein